MTERNIYQNISLFSAYLCSSMYFAKSVPLGDLSFASSPLMYRVQFYATNFTAISLNFRKRRRDGDVPLRQGQGLLLAQGGHQGARGGHEEDRDPAAAATTTVQGHLLARGRQAGRNPAGTSTSQAATSAATTASASALATAPSASLSRPTSSASRPQRALHSQTSFFWRSSG